MHCIRCPYDVHHLYFLRWHVHRYFQHTCTPVSSHWQKYTQFALWPKNSTDVFQMQDKASFIELISKARGNSPVTWLHSRHGIHMDIDCKLVTREIAGKQTTESLPDNTWKRKGPGTGAVCVWADSMCSYFSSLHLLSYLPSAHERIPVEEPSLWKSSQRVCLCQALACFRDYIFSYSFPSPEFPSSFCPRGIQQRLPSPPPDTRTHPLVKMHTSALRWRLWEVIKTISCITVNVVWHQENSMQRWFINSNTTWVLISI